MSAYTDRIAEIEHMMHVNMISENEYWDLLRWAADLRTIEEQAAVKATVKARQWARRMGNGDRWRSEDWELYFRENGDWQIEYEAALAELQAQAATTIE